MMNLSVHSIGSDTDYRDTGRFSSGETGCSVDWEILQIVIVHSFDCLYSVMEQLPNLGKLP